LVIVWILMCVTIAVAGASVAGRRMASDRQVTNEVQRILQEHGIDPGDMPDSLPRRTQWVEDLPEQAQRDLRAALRGHLARSVNWPMVGAVSALILYGGVGFACGYLTRSYILLGLIPACVLLLGSPVGNYVALPRQAQLRGSQWVLLAALAAVYLFGFLGARLARWRDRQRWTRPGS
ncbi:MAG: hypothetical protein R6V05_07960, partial [Candidatus Brocadiia bacterium]